MLSGNCRAICKSINSEVCMCLTMMNAIDFLGEQ